MKIKSMAGMMSRIAYCAVLGLAMVSCYDDSDLRATLDDHEQRLEAIDSNIAALQTLVEAVEDADYIVSVKVIKKDGEEVGYEITFAEHGEIEIYHGTDGKDGKDGTGNGDSIFKEVYESDGFMCFELQDGTTYKIPMTAEGGQSSGLDIIFDVEQGFALGPGDTSINYTIVGGDENTLVRVIETSEHIDAVVIPETSDKGSILLFCNDMYDEDYSFAILISVSDGRNNSILKSLNFSRGIIDVESVHYIEREAGSLRVPVETNLDFEVVVRNGSDWLRHVPQTRSSLRTDEIVFEYDANEGYSRQASVILQGANGFWYKRFTVMQRGSEPIIIDGDFNDWDALDPSAVSVAFCDPEAPLQALKVMKVISDPKCIYFYFEYDTELVDMTSWLPVHIFIDSDGVKTTGGYSVFHLDAYCDIMLEGGIYSEEGPISFDASLFFWKGEVGADGWDGWVGPNPDASNDWGADIIGGITTGAGDNGKYEIAVDREMTTATFADTFYVGLEIEYNWDPIGVLPNAASTDDNPAGRAPMLRVTTTY